MCGDARILIVDAERDVRDALEAILANNGHQVSTAATEIEVVTVLSTRKIDLIIVDPWNIELGPIMNYRARKILTTTSKTEARDGFEIVLRKPFGIQQLVEAIATCCRGVACRHRDSKNPTLP